MKFFHKRFSGWLKYATILFSIAMASCGVQNKLRAPNTIDDDERPFCWRVEIKVQLYNNDVYDVLTAFGKIPQPVLLNPLNDLPWRTGPGTIVIYITATNNQVQRLRGSLLQAGTIELNINKVNHY
jgi:hypothetical protein